MYELLDRATAWLDHQHRAQALKLMKAGRGDRQGTIATVEYVLKALKEGNPAVLLGKPAASLEGLEERIFKICARARN